MFAATNVLHIGEFIVFTPIQINEAETYPYIYPAIADYSEKLKTGEIKFQELFIDTDKGYLSLQYLHIPESCLVQLMNMAQLLR